VKLEKIRIIAVRKMPFTSTKSSGVKIIGSIGSSNVSPAK